MNINRIHFQVATPYVLNIDRGCTKVVVVVVVVVVVAVVVVIVVVIVVVVEVVVVVVVVKESEWFRYGPNDT